MLLILYKPKGKVYHKDLLVDSSEAEEYLQDFPRSICVSHSGIDDFYHNFNTKCFNGMFGEYKIRDWLVPKNNKNFIILKHETVDVQTQTR